MSDEGQGKKDEIPDDPVRSRIIDATFQVLMEKGYAGASTREIARRARVSKRELYALFESKEGILAAMIGGRAVRMRQPLALPSVSDRDGLAQVLTRFGLSLLREGSNPAVMAIMRLAVAEAERAPDLARRLDEDARQPIRSALIGLLTGARASRLIDGDLERMATQFLALLWGDWQMRLLMRLRDEPASDEVERRAAEAVATFLAVYPEPVSPP